MKQHQKRPCKGFTDKKTVCKSHASAGKDYCGTHLRCIAWNKHGKRCAKDRVSNSDLCKAHAKLHRWIPTGFHEAYRRKIAKKMCLRTAKDPGRGFLYMFHYSDGNSKVGSTIRDAKKRIEEWQGDCGMEHGTATPIWYPNGNKGIPAIHAVETLCRLELDIRGYKPKKKKCDYCGKMHNEIFNFKKTPAEAWEHIVLPTVEHWSSFINDPESLHDDNGGDEGDDSGSDGRSDVQKTKLVVKDELEDKGFKTDTRSSTATRAESRKPSVKLEGTSRKWIKRGA